MTGRTRRGSYAVVLLVLAAFSCCSCDALLNGNVYEKANAEAEEGVAIALDYTVRHLGELMTRNERPEDLTKQDLTAVFVHDLSTRRSEAPATIVDGRALYKLHPITGAVEFSVFLGSKAFRSGGIDTAHAAKYGCGILTGNFGTAKVALRDETCPSRFHAWAGDYGEEVPLSRLARKYDVDVSLQSERAQ